MRMALAVVVRMIVSVSATGAMLVGMAMRVRIGGVRVVVIVPMPVIVIVTVPMVVVVHALGERVVFVECGIVPMPMAAAISAGFRLKRQRSPLDERAEPHEHRLQHGIGL